MMSSFREGVKRLVLNTLPDWALVPLKRRHYARSIAKLSIDEEPDLRVVRTLVREGETVVDVGANVGVYTRFLLEFVGSTGLVIAVEPVPQTFDILSSVVSSLGRDNIRLHNVALSDKPGEVTMVVPQYDTGGSNFYQARITSDGSAGSQAALRVRAQTLDSLLAELTSVSFVKIDVEGAELQCLSGATDMLSRLRPALLIEVSEDPDIAESSAGKLFALLAGAGYRPFFFDGSSLRARTSGTKSINYFFLQAEHEPRVEPLLEARRS